MDVDIPDVEKPEEQAPWEIYRIQTGFKGRIRCSAVSPTNQFFATGSGDRVVKLWDLANCQLKATLAHENENCELTRGVRGVGFHPGSKCLMFSYDEQAKCWDAEQEKLLRTFRYHQMWCTAMAVHPTELVLATAGMTAGIRHNPHVTNLWDVRTEKRIERIGGHEGAITSILLQANEPQVITASEDGTIRLFDWRAGKTRYALSSHEKPVVALTFLPNANAFVSASAHDIKQWSSDKGEFIRDLSGHNPNIYCLGASKDGVLVSGADNGAMHFWDWNTGRIFQCLQTRFMPSEKWAKPDVFSISFDMLGNIMIATKADGTFEMYRKKK